MTTEPGDPIGAFDVGDPMDYEMIVPMGSTFSLTDPDRISTWIHDELDFLRRADRAGVPVLGVCFGGQALAAAHGGRVEKSDRPQIGWHALAPDSDAETPLDGPWMQWHYDRFEPPSDAQVLARDEVGVQAFRLRRNLGVQFHPEVTRSHVERWIGFGGGSELEGLGVSIDQLLEQTDRLHEDARQRTFALVDWFLSDVARS